MNDSIENSIAMFYLVARCVDMGNVCERNIS